MYIGMARKKHWLTQYTDMQGEHIPQQCYISHNHPYISSSEYSKLS